MKVLPVVDGCVHLSVEAGCGGTTFALQSAREILIEHHVIWICNEMPDGNRMSQLFADVSPISVSKLHVAVVGDNISHGIMSAMGLMVDLDSLGLIVVDDWAPKSGHVPSEVITSIRELIELCEKRKVPLLLVSSAYEDASGQTGWKSRGDIDTETWFLHKSEDGLAIRELNCGDSTIKFSLLDEGFILRK